MRKITATYIYPGDGPPLKHGILTLEEDGTVAGIKDTGGMLREESGLEHYSGIVVPGFIDAYCKLERTVQSDDLHRDASPDTESGKNRHTINTDLRSVMTVDITMQHEGIVAAADSVCTTTTIKVKQNSRIEYHSFIPVSNISSPEAVNDYNTAERLKQKFGMAGLRAIITPYLKNDLEDEGFKQIREQSIEGNNNFLMLNQASRLLLVSSTPIDENEIEIFKTKTDKPKVFCVLTPYADLKSLIDLPQDYFFKEEKQNICIGTGSISFNSRYSLIQLMFALQLKYPKLTLQELIEWCCLNGAKALGIDHRAGSFRKGKKPGVNLITGTDLKELKLTATSKIKVLQYPV